MSDQIVNIDDLTQLTELDGEDFLAGIDDSQVDLTKKTIICKLKNWFTNGLYLNSSRIAFQEKSSSALTVSGWYTIAEMRDFTTAPYSGDFDCSLFGGFREETAGCIVKNRMTLLFTDEHS